MDEYDFEYMDKQIKLLNAKKQSTRDMLKIINCACDHKILLNVIDGARNLDEVSTINRLLVKSYCFKNNIDENTIKKQIEKDASLNKILFGKSKKQ